MMNNPRRMRRQARRIRRGGMEPMMMITGHDRLPESAVVVLPEELKDNEPTLLDRSFMERFLRFFTLSFRCSGT